MEPMALGSPASSPPSILFQPTVTQPYLPSFLIGDAQTASANSFVSPGGLSPGRTVKQTSNMSPAGTIHHVRDVNLFSNANKLANERQSGPPVFGLSSGLPQSPASNKPSSWSPLPLNFGTSPAPIASQTSHNSPASFILSPFKEFTSVATDSFLDNSSTATDDNTWVTVFGFPPASASYILTQFAQIGSVVEHRNLGSGNWMHIKYQTKLQAHKALSKNGKVFFGNIMVGVVPCTDKNLNSQTSNTTTFDSSILSPNNSIREGYKSPIRPLTQAYQSARAENEVVPNSNTPKKSESIVSRAIHHILGL